MKFMTFDYTDSKGKQGKRQVVQLSAPSNLHFCVDVAELEPSEMYLIQDELEALEKEFKQRRDEILTKYDVKSNYRYFKPDSMTNITEEE